LGVDVTASPLPPLAPLLPRYQRPLSFGGVLDETFRLYRMAWVKLMAVSALAALPGAVAVVLLTGQLYFSVFDLAAAGEDNPEELLRLFTGLGLGVLLASLASGLGALVGQGGVTAMTGWLMRGQAVSVGASLLAALRKLLVMLGSGIVYGLGVFLLTLVATPLFVVTGFGILGGLIALVGMMVWVNRPEEQRGNGLKWLIILTAPYGLPLYYGVRWSLAIPAIFQERAGPVQALRRSAELVDRRWFPVFGVWFVLWVVIALLQTIPAGVIAVFGSALGTNAADPSGAGLTVSVAQNAASIVGTVLFGALSFIAATLMFVDARNRREGADLAERLTQIEGGVPVSS
jgi:hypothetical protein